MSKLLLLALAALALLAETASGAPADRDRDGLPDRWERRYHIPTTKKSGRGDADHDGLRNRREYRLRTNPRRKDTDRDGLRDRAEVRRYKTNPRRKDTDGDGRKDGVEVRAGTNPLKKDTDGDGYDDKVEAIAGTDPRDANSHPAAGPSPSPPPSPSPSPSPSSFPDASTTGVPAGMSLTPSGGMTISTAGAVVDGREITGQVVVNAPNVTIRNSRIRSNSMWVVDNRSTGLVIEDSEILNRPVSGQNNCHNAIGDANFTVRRSEITGCENASNIGGDNVTFVDNFVHDLDTNGPSYVWGMDPHTDGLQMSPGADNIVVRHNTIDPSPGGGVTSPIIMGVNGSQNDVWIEDNFLDGAGASYALYLPRQVSQNINVNRNRMTRGAGGYTACAKLGQTVASFSENRDANTGAAIGPDNGAGGGCTN